MSHIYEKLQPFFDELKRKGTADTFEASDWLKDGTPAFEFAKKNLTSEEQETLLLMVHALYSI